ncbi:MAG: two-component system response regulator AlgR [Cellvibrionaceae bacterium]|jgi:two-component system response regulator AlgR
MDVLIVDDEPLARLRLKKMVIELGYDVVAEASNSETAFAAVSTYDPALLLLDIEMPGENGLAIAEKISLLETPPAIIFTTAYDQYALEAFDTVAASYLLKPVEKLKLEKALEKAKTLNKFQLASADLTLKNKGREHIASKGHRGIELIDIKNIRHFMADQKYVMIFSAQGKVLIDETLKDLEEEFSKDFVRVHRNSLVSIKHILGLDRDQQGHYHVRLQDTDEKPMVSRRYASKVKSLLKKL